MELENPIEIINRIFLALMDDRGGFIQAHLDYIRKHQPLKDYEIWKARNNLSQHTLEVISIYHLKTETTDIYREPTLKLFQKLAEYTKTDNAKKLMALQYLATDLNALNFKYFDNLLQEYIIWQETKSLKELYNLTEVYRGDNYGLYTADMYNNAIFYIKANGEKVDATNNLSNLNPWCISEDANFDLNKKYETLQSEVLRKINRDPMVTVTYSIQEYTPDQKVIIKILELKMIEDKLATIEQIFPGFELKDTKKTLQNKMAEMYKISNEMGITEKVKARLDQMLAISKPKK